VVQLYPRELDSSGTSGVPLPVPTIVGPWGEMEILLSKISRYFGERDASYLYCIGAYRWLPQNEAM
jgi:hypothetical protein